MCVCMSGGVREGESERILVRVRRCVCMSVGVSEGESERILVRE
jgi:hypothetical protein